jgi:hypothetical protein
MIMSNTTVFRMTKLQSLQELNNKGKHCYDYSHKEIFNFKQKGEFKNPFHTLIGKSQNVYRDVKNLKSKYDIHERKNSCKAIEAVFSLSPEFFEENKKGKIEDFTKRTKEFLNEKFKNQVAHAVLHLHETTPHIHVFIVPFEVSTKKGRYDCEPYNALTAKKYTPDYLSKLQNEYNKHFEELGFKKVKPKMNKGIDRKELKDFYLEQAEENNKNKKIINGLEVESNENKEIITTLEIENELLKKDLNLTKKDLNQTKEKLSKLEKIIEYVKEFFNVERMKDLVSKVKPVKEPVKENNIDCVSFDNSDDDEFVNDFYETQKQKLAPTPKPTKKKSKGLSLGLRR